MIDRISIAHKKTLGNSECRVCWNTQCTPPTFQSLALSSLQQPEQQQQEPEEPQFQQLQLHWHQLEQQVRQPPPVGSAVDGASAISFFYVLRLFFPSDKFRKKWPTKR